MTKKEMKKNAIAIFSGCLVFLSILLLTQYLSYQEYFISQEKERKNLVEHSSIIKDKFQSILSSDIDASNTLSIISSEYGFPKDFNTVAQKILSKGKYVSVIQLSQDNVITNVYPLEGNKEAIGTDKLANPILFQELKEASKKREVHFAGPRELKQGGYGILGQTPIFIDGKLRGHSIVITKLSVIRKELSFINDNKEFSYALSRNSKQFTKRNFYLNGIRPNKNSKIVSVDIPEGDWQLRVAYSDNHHVSAFPYTFSILGIALALISGLFIYRKANERKTLFNEVDEKSYILNKRIKELSAIYKINTLLLDEEQSFEELFFKVIELVKTGWQYPEICEVKITFEGKEYCTKAYKKSPLNQQAEINLQDGRKGLIEVVYIQKNKPFKEIKFMSEEYELLKSIANILEVYLNKTEQKQKLAFSENRFRTAFELASIGMGMLSLDGSWIKVNKALCEMLGYSEEEFLKSNFQQMTYSEDLANSLEIRDNFLKSGKESQKFEKRYLHKNGSVIWVNMNVVAIRGNKNEPLYLVAQIENVTDKIESQIIFMDLVDKSRVGIYILKDGKIAYVNPQLVEKLGYSQDESIVGAALEQFIYDEDLPIVHQKIQERLEGNLDSLRYEARLKNKDGSIIWCEIFSATTIYQGEKASIGTIVDVTEQKIFYDKLQQSEANMKSMFDSTTVSFVLIDAGFNIVSFNEHFKQFHKIRTGNEPIIGKSLTQQIAPSRKNIFSELFNTALVNDKTIEYNDELLNEGELTKYFHFIITPVKNKEATIGLCIAINDISDQKKMELEKVEIIGNLSQRNQDLEQFSYIVSHNIRMPLSNLLGLVTLMENEISQEDKVFFNEAVKESAHQLDNVISDVNQILRIRKEQQHAKEKIEIADEIEKIRVKFNDIIDNTKAKIICDFSAVNIIHSIPIYINSILLNLISNSLKFTTDDISPEIKIWSEKEGSFIKIYIKDNGTGIDLKKNRSKIFGLYKRFDLSKEGKGMGLFMVKNQMAALNGTISVESELGKGSLFTLCLPLN
jgi:PAS domain S-box-containing protein